MFKALLLEKGRSRLPRAASTTLDEPACPRWPRATCWCGREYSTLNYKDGLALTNRSPVVRTWPMVPGIDGAGTVTRQPPPGLAAPATASCTTAGASARRTGAAWPSGRG